eukprot:sb/3468483/
MGIFRSGMRWRSRLMLLSGCLGACAMSVPVFSYGSIYIYIYILGGVGNGQILRRSRLQVHCSLGPPLTLCCTLVSCSHHIPCLRHGHFQIGYAVEKQADALIGVSRGVCHERSSIQLRFNGTLHLQLPLDAGLLSKVMNERILYAIFSALLTLIMLSLYWFGTTYIALSIYMCAIGFCGGNVLVYTIGKATEWNPSKSGAANGVIGFFIGISGFIGSFICTVYVNPNNVQTQRVFDPAYPELELQIPQRFGRNPAGLQ